MKLFGYWRSTAAYRVRIALNLKGIHYDTVPVHLVRNGGEQFSATFQDINPNSVVPALALNDGRVLTQSLAIIEYLDETHAEPRLVPSETFLRARVRAAAQIVACDIHPVNNLRVTGYLKQRLGHSQDEATTWMQHWMRQGLEAYQKSIDNDGRYSFGETVTLADLCLVPQLYNAKRWQLDMQGLDRLQGIANACMSLEAFKQAAPEAQVDAE